MIPQQVLVVQSRFSLTASECSLTSSVASRRHPKPRAGRTPATSPAGIVAHYQASLPSAVVCFMDDIDAWIANLRQPITHRRAIRTTNLLERLYLEKRRRLQIIRSAFGEKVFLKLMFAAMTRAAVRWHIDWALGLLTRRLGWPKMVGASMQVSAYSFAAAPFSRRQSEFWLWSS